MTLLQKLFFCVYLLLVMPIVVGLALTIGLLNRKVRTGIGERLRLNRSRRKFPEPPIWIHASSGEFEYAKPIIRELKNRHPDVPVLVTYFSPSYRRQIANFPGVDQAEPLPLDLPGPVHDFLKFYRPRLALFSRTDLWPELLRQTRRRRIPSLLFSCTRPPLSGMRKLSVPFYRLFYSLLDKIHCVSTSDHQNLSLLTTTPIEVTGDTRYDQVAHRLSQARDFSAKLEPSTVPCLVAGSTWPQDEAVLLPAVAPLIKDGKLRLIIAPHEPTPSHLEHLRKDAQALGIESISYSDVKTWDGKTILLIDQVGLLAELYPVGDLAFVGGSFRAKVHSVMEALGAGLPVIVGPHYHNNREAVEFTGLPITPAHFAVTSVRAADSLRALVSALAALPRPEREHIREVLKAEFARRQGASQKVLDWVENHLRPDA